jgi:1-acyl-sn-glycerol-3-phosphate acyltransferase
VSGFGDRIRSRRPKVPLRARERCRPAFVDPTRPTTAVAAFPGGVVPDDVP